MGLKAGARGGETGERGALSVLLHAPTLSSLVAEKAASLLLSILFTLSSKFVCDDFRVVIWCFRLLTLD